MSSVAKMFTRSGGLRSIAAAIRAPAAMHEAISWAAACTHVGAGLQCRNYSSGFSGAVIPGCTVRVEFVGTETGKDWGSGADTTGGPKPDAVQFKVG
jgi:hypothetical protein